MAEQQQAARKQSRSKRDKPQETETGTGKNGHEDEVARYEQELADYLLERIKPGLNSGAIPLLARSIAKDIAHREHPNGVPESGQAGGESKAETEDKAGAESEPAPDFEADMRELQAELGEHWILRFSVQGDDGWLTAEKDDGSQRVEAPEASVLIETVGLLNERGGRST